MTVVRLTPNRVRDVANEIAGKVGRQELIDLDWFQAPLASAPG